MNPSFQTIVQYMPKGAAFLPQPSASKIPTGITSEFDPVLYPSLAVDPVPAEPYALNPYNIGYRPRGHAFMPPASEAPPNAEGSINPALYPSLAVGPAPAEPFALNPYNIGYRPSGYAFMPPASEAPPNAEGSINPALYPSLAVGPPPSPSPPLKKKSKVNQRVGHPKTSLFTKGGKRQSRRKSRRQFRRKFRRQSRRTKPHKRKTRKH